MIFFCFTLMFLANMLLGSSQWHRSHGCWRYRQQIPSEIARHIVGRRKVLIATSSLCA